MANAKTKQNPEGLSTEELPTVVQTPVDEMPEMAKPGVFTLPSGNIQENF